MWSKVTIEDIVTTCMVIVGVIGGLLIGILWPNLPPFWSSIFVALGVAAFVYRFLGGISKETSATVMGFKLGGSLAATIIVFLLFNKVLTVQREWTPPDNLILSFSKGEHPIKQFITVKPKNYKVPIEIKDGNFILSLKDLKASDGKIFINYQRPEPTGDINENEINMDYYPNPPKIELHLDFLDNIDKKSFGAKNVTLTFREGIKLLRDSGLTIKDDNGEPIPERSGEFSLPLNVKGGGGISIERKEQLSDSIKILELEYKVDPPEIRIHLDKDYLAKRIDKDTFLKQRK